ncbi:hypothetical protein [Listeria ivanovii]|uniref:hypothetical protein n=1 Tax=Listeria ivanovii TaxID=1638 RepID=UPI00194170CC|nr:hypothetical protein [Listeria ivanovii]MBM5707348.1 hypothetical protein [Listeria ivanovii]
MKITYDIFNVDGFEKRPTIGFDSKENVGLEDLLNVDTSLITLDDILSEIDKVESGESSLEEIGSERSMVEIRKDECIIYDSFEGIVEDDELYPTIKMPTPEFKKIVVEWKAERKRLLDRINNEK